MPTPSVPPISHLQAIALGALAGGDRSGSRIRELMAEHGVKRTLAAFYQLMARLERDGLVEGRYQQVKVGDQHVTERWYRLTAAGARTWARTRAFYQSIAAAADGRWSRA